MVAGAAGAVGGVAAAGLAHHIGQKELREYNQKPGIGQKMRKPSFVGQLNRDSQRAMDLKQGVHSGIGAGASALGGAASALGGAVHSGASAVASGAGAVGTGIMDGVRAAGGAVATAMTSGTGTDEGANDAQAGADEAGTAQTFDDPPPGGPNQTAPTGPMGRGSCEQPMANLGLTFGRRGSGPDPGQRIQIDYHHRSAGSNPFGNNRAIGAKQYAEELSDANDKGNVIGQGEGVAGQGAKSSGLVPIINVAACRFFFRSSDYAALSKFYSKDKLDYEKAKLEMDPKSAQQAIDTTSKIYGKTLGISQQQQPPSGKEGIYMLALECKQLMKALEVYQKETQGMFQAENTMSSAVDAAVDSIVHGKQPGLYPYFGSKDAMMVKHATQPNQNKRPPIMGEFKMRNADRKKIKAFHPINYA